MQWFWFSGVPILHPRVPLGYDGTTAEAERRRLEGVTCWTMSMSDKMAPLVSHDSLRILTAAAQVREEIMEKERDRASLIIIKAQTLVHAIVVGRTNTPTPVPCSAMQQFRALLTTAQ